MSISRWSFISQQFLHITSSLPLWFWFLKLEIIVCETVTEAILFQYQIINESDYKDNEIHINKGKDNGGLGFEMLTYNAEFLKNK